MNIPIPPGVFDLIPTDTKESWRSTYLWNYVESVIRETAVQYGFQEIRTPLFERTELFKRGVGETSDIVSKEMYTFDDKGGRSLSLRPEGTAPVIRAYIEHQLYNEAPIHKLYYIAPMFRYERAQAGRYRQHHQFGTEVFGNTSPEQDAELIDLLYTLYNRLGLTNLQVCLNTIGDASCRIAYRQALQDYLRSSYDQLSKDSQTRFETNPLRILDSKDAKDREILVQAPTILDFLNSESKDHFEAVKKLLNSLKIPYTINPQLVRGLDYYNNTVFEVIAGELGAQNSIGGGGRYDGLMKTLGGPDMPGIGFGTGIERIIQTMLKQNVAMPSPNRPTLFIIPLGDEAKAVCFSILHDLRQHNVAAQMDFSGKKLAKVMQYANQIGAQFVTVVGDNELKSKQIELKEMATGNKMQASIDHLSRILQVETKAKDFIKIWKEMSQPFEDPSEAAYFVKKISQSIEDTKKITQTLENAVEKIKDLLEDKKN